MNTLNFVSIIPFLPESGRVAIGYLHGFAWQFPGQFLFRILQNKMPPFLEKAALKTSIIWSVSSI
ncbi:hypothetical protein LV564_14235 [Komagataeibacter nataicola]|uniref:hypothetical protein n=1 Tax=Komagataeibacter nataicola TaxID=265960 RepID=UPI00125DA3A4|nr:hypothetical protein [Komagataeibacter nataicola]WEQ55244.1 hypothetical protein LV564_14235 [Komagataeibacter nataicola]WNM09874.1 hypothetical protein RI056_08470 [Komagataeibacter nataicola]